MNNTTNNRLLRFILPMILLLASHTLLAQPVVDHRIEVSIDPETGSLTVKDTVTLPDNGNTGFTLHAGLKARILTPGVQLSQTSRANREIPLQGYRVSLPQGVKQFTLEYTGKIKHGFTTTHESTGRSRQRLAGTISSEGVFLDAGVAWYPRFSGSLKTFSLSVDLPDGWLVVSQGSGPVKAQDSKTTVWSANLPQDDIYLIAAPFHFYSKQQGNTEAQVFLRQKDPNLAERYLQATSRYLTLYEKLIGPYPYAKFALVENFWETGYGMPSFTLLGSRVIRLPFIIYTSYPHEILHNWWGNGVYVDYAHGNWSEGLTSYLADHLLKEQRGQGMAYRRSALQRYGDFVRDSNDFPLTAFRSRHTSASQSVGYDKALMMFHMLRRKLGDEQFVQGLRSFYRDNQFKQAGYAELRSAFEQVSGSDLRAFFQQWTERKGAPRLELSELKVAAQADGYRLSGKLRQTQAAAPFELDIPIIIYLADAPPLRMILPMREHSLDLNFTLAGKPLRLEIDPWLDLFRELHPDEVPPVFSKLFGAEQLLIVLPADAREPLLEGYGQLANQWASGNNNIEIRLDKDLSQLPEDRQIWLMGRENQFLEILNKTLNNKDYYFSDETVSIKHKTFPRSAHSFALAGRSESGNTIAWLTSDDPASLPGLARKLPHYGKYSYLVFEGERPDNRAKGQWDASRSPLQRQFHSGPVDRITPPASLLDALDNLPHPSAEVTESTLQKLKM
ncbi:MAG: M1 family peptidase [Gammaproteobacteria bacterium (ex Lamellibrachia satsuma)]|nr:MAG: M1 family peptidase [Gammaproteobacteria bacterium (ex Lamellibrachia satsuma)]